MPYTMEDFRRDYILAHLEEVLTRDEILQRFSADEILQRFSADERLKELSIDERLKGLSPAEIRTYLEKLEKPQKP